MGKYMEIRNLITFVRIAEVHSFSKTAEQLGYSQSAVTMQMKQLENELHMQLFERLGKNIKLTPAGERLLPYALEILNCAAKAESIVQEPEEITGRLCIGTCESFVSSILPPIMSELNALCPKLEISTPTPLEKDLFDQLRQNDVDLIYFLDVKLDFPEWIKVAEKEEKVHFVASVHSPLAKEETVSMEQLLAAPMCLTEKGISYRYALEQQLSGQGYELHPFWEVGNTDVITDIVLSNRGISFLPEYVVKKYVDRNDLVILSTECPEITMYSQLAYHKNKFVTPQMEIFMELVKKQMQSV